MASAGCRGSLTQAGWLWRPRVIGEAGGGEPRSPWLRLAAKERGPAAEARRLSRAQLLAPPAADQLLPRETQSQAAPGPTGIASARLVTSRPSPPRPPPLPSHSVSAFIPQGFAPFLSLAPAPHRYSRPCHMPAFIVTIPLSPQPQPHRNTPALGKSSSMARGGGGWGWAETNRRRETEAQQC